MKTIYVEPKDVKIGEKVIGEVNNINVNGNIQLFSNKLSIWVGVQGVSGASLANHNLEILCPDDKVIWSDVEKDILSQLGLTKSANQTPALPSIKTP